MGDTEIKGNVLIRLFLSFLKHVFSKNYAKIYEQMIPFMVELAHKDIFYL